MIILLSDRHASTELTGSQSLGRGSQPGNKHMLPLLWGISHAGQEAAPQMAQETPVRVSSARWQVSDAQARAHLSSFQGKRGRFC